MHARLDELLSLRDGEPVDARVRTHVDGCPECTSALASTGLLRARLRTLPPAPEPAADGWAGVQSRLAATRGRRPWAVRLAPFAAAASIAALGLFASVRLVEDPALPEVSPAPQVLAEPAALEDLRARSQALEALLAAMPARPTVERADTSVPIDSLEAQVQWLDHQLSLAGADGRVPETERLWRDRVEVMNSLVQLRYVEAQHVVL